MTAALRVTVVDLVDGHEESLEVPAGDYLIVAAEPCHVARIDTSGHGATHVVTVKGRTNRGGPARASVTYERPAGAAAAEGSRD